MSYQVLARKWRPKSLKEMVGQEHILRMLTNSLDHQRLHHAYLFTGTRGVGKTTLARILAKCLNCEKGISSTPCDQCGICLSIDSGRFLDLIEIDAASRTKVEDTREILDNVQYAPAKGRYKIYLIDEVHMLSGHSFNALLKTLEEPPSHVKFLLATTDPKRLPITILSRCLQFNLKRVPVEQINSQLEYICQKEEVTYETSALKLVAQAADGSMRDALSLLDQTIAFCRDNITEQHTRQMLGNVQQDIIFKLLHALAEQDGKKLINEIAHLTEQTVDFQQALEEMLSILHQISVAQVISDLPNTHEEIKNLAQQFTPEETQLYYQIALIGRRDLPLAGHPTQGFEMVMLRMLAFRPVIDDPNTLSNPIKTNTIPNTNPSEKKSDSLPNTDLSNWNNILTKLNLTGLAHVLASNCILIQMKDHHIELALAATHASMLNKKLLERIEQALTQVLNKPIKLDIKIADNEIQTPAKQQKAEQVTKQINASEAIKNDTQVQKLMDMFGATLDPGSIQAIDSI
jgi:DNA polymerase-3 subunit gamma/tau